MKLIIYSIVCGNLGLISAAVILNIGDQAGDFGIILFGVIVFFVLGFMFLINYMKSQKKKTLRNKKEYINYYLIYMKGD